MKMKFYPRLRLLAGALLLLCQLQGQAQTVYFRETFIDGTGPTADPGATSTQVDYVSGTGTWKFYGVWLTTGTSCLNDGTVGTGNRHIRSTNNTAITDSGYIITPDVIYGIASVNFQRSRVSRRITIYVNSNNTTDPNNAGWTLISTVPKSTGSPVVLCSDTTVAVPAPNAALARRMMFRFERATNTDIDSIQLNSVLPIILPVTYASFQGARNDNGVSLRWSVSAEINTVRYEVERSINGVEFQAIGNQRASRNSAYGYLDANAPQTTVYYRIKAVDDDGRTTLSEVVKVAGSNQAAKTLSVWPNPVQNGQLNMRLSGAQGSVSISLHNSEGLQSFAAQTSGNGQSINLQVPTASLAKGIYLLRVQSASGSYTERVVVQ